jgi:hypothetical protein
MGFTHLSGKKTALATTPPPIKILPKASLRDLICPASSSFEVSLIFSLSDILYFPF